MRYRTFAIYNIIGGVLWGAGVTYLGYLLGQIKMVRDNIDLIFLLIVAVSVLPIVIEVAKRVIASRRVELRADPVEEDTDSSERVRS